MSNADQINAGMNEYNQVRQPGDIDLVAEVRNMLMAAGLGQKVLAYYDNDHYVLDAANKAPNIQRFILNRYWNLQLLKSPVNSMEQRYCLIPNGEISAWIQLFRDSIIPFLVANDLPNQ